MRSRGKGHDEAELERERIQSRLDYMRPKPYDSLHRAWLRSGAAWSNYLAMIAKNSSIGNGSARVGLGGSETGQDLCGRLFLCTDHTLQMAVSNHPKAWP